MQTTLQRGQLRIAGRKFTEPPVSSAFFDKLAA
jgi:hypothetical protein